MFSILGIIRAFHLVCNFSTMNQCGTDAYRMPAFSTTKDSRIPFNNDNQQRLKRMKRQSGFRDADRNEDEDDDDDDDDDDSWSVFDPYVSRFSDLFCPPPLICPSAWGGAYNPTKPGALTINITHSL